MDLNSALIIDDSKDDRYIIRRYLAEVKDNCVFFESTNGKEALEFLEDFDANKQQHGDSFPPEVIFLDINMPVMTGFEFLEKFNQLSTTNDYGSIVVAMISSSDREEDKTRAMQYPCVRGFIPKFPESAEELSQQIDIIAGAS